MDMMAQFMPRPGTKYSDPHLVFCYSFSVVSVSSIWSVLFCRTTERQRISFRCKNRSKYSQIFFSRDVICFEKGIVFGK